MTKKNIVIFLSVFAVLLFSQGCMKALQKESIETLVPQIYEEDKEPQSFEQYKKFIADFLQKTKEIKVDTTTYEDLFVLGLNPEAINIQYYPGETPEAKKYMVGTSSVNIQTNYPAQLSAYMEEYSRYVVLVYPLHLFREASDNFYFSKKSGGRYGVDMEYVIILYDNVVKRKYKKGTAGLARRKIEKSFASGAVSTLQSVKDLGQNFLFLYILQQTLSTDK